MGKKNYGNIDVYSEIRRAIQVYIFVADFALEVFQTTSVILNGSYG